MGSHTLEILRQGLWASVTGGWFYDPHQTLFCNTVHLYLWLFLAILPFTLYLSVPMSLLICTSYSALIGVLFAAVKITNYRLHHMFDTSEVHEELLADNLGDDTPENADNRDETVMSQTAQNDVEGTGQLADGAEGIEMQTFGNTVLDGSTTSLPRPVKCSSRSSLAAGSCTPETEHNNTTSTDNEEHHVTEDLEVDVHYTAENADTDELKQDESDRPTGSTHTTMQQPCMGTILLGIKPRGERCRRAMRRTKSTLDDPECKLSSADMDRTVRASGSIVSGSPPVPITVPGVSKMSHPNLTGVNKVRQRYRSMMENRVSDAEFDVCSSYTKLSLNDLDTLRDAHGSQTVGTSAIGHEVTEVSQVTDHNRRSDREYGGQCCDASSVIAEPVDRQYSACLPDDDVHTDDIILNDETEDLNNTTDTRCGVHPSMDACARDDIQCTAGPSSIYNLITDTSEERQAIRDATKDFTEDDYTEQTRRSDLNKQIECSAVLPSLPTRDLRWIRQATDTDQQPQTNEHAAANKISAAVENTMGTSNESKTVLKKKKVPTATLR